MEVEDDDEDDLDEEEYDPADAILLALRAAAPAGSIASLRPPTTRSTGAQTGGVRGAGRTLAAPKPEGVDAGTLVRQLRVSLPLLKAANADQGLLDLLLNALISAKVKRGKSVTIP